MSNYISDLGIGPYAIIQNVNFIVSGLLIGFFALGTLANLPSRAGASMRNAVRATGIAAIGTILAGVTLMLWSAFPTDYSIFWIHTAVSFIAFFALGAAPILTWRSLKGDDSWGNYPSASLVGGILTVVAIFIFFFSLGTTFYGLTERLVVAVPLVWIAGTGAKFYSRTSRATDIPS